MVPEPPKIGELFKDAGKRWRILETTTKPYPICGHAMTPVEAALLLKESIDIDRLKSLKVFTNSTALRIAGNKDPHDEYQAKFSIPYCIAVALLFKRVTQEEFHAKFLKQLNVRSLMRKIELVADEAFDNDFEFRRPARIEAIAYNNSIFKVFAENRRGGPENPLTDEEKRDKFLNLCRLPWGEKIAKEILARGKLLFDLDDICRWIDV